MQIILEDAEGKVKNTVPTMYMKEKRTEMKCPRFKIFKVFDVLLVLSTSPLEPFSVVEDWN